MISKEWAGADEIHCLDADLERSKPAPDQGHIVVVRSHVSLLGLRLGAGMVRLPSLGVKRSAKSSFVTE